MLEVTVSIKSDKGEPKVYRLRQTVEAAKNPKTGHTCLAQFQPEEGNPVLPSFTKLHIDTSQLGNKPSK